MAVPSALAPGVTNTLVHASMEGQHSDSDSDSDSTTTRRVVTNDNVVEIFDIVVTVVALMIIVVTVVDPFFSVTSRCGLLFFVEHVCL